MREGAQKVWETSMIRANKGSKVGGKVKTPKKKEGRNRMGEILDQKKIKFLSFFFGGIFVVVCDLNFLEC